MHTVRKNDPKVEVCVNKQPTIPGHVHTLKGSETTFHKIVTHIGGPKNPKNPRNLLENGVLFTIVANGLRGVLVIYNTAITEHGNTVSLTLRY